jgi:hypothetical protein
MYDYIDQLKNNLEKKPVKKLKIFAINQGLNETVVNKLQKHRIIELIINNLRPSPDKFSRAIFFESFLNGKLDDELFDRLFEVLTEDETTQVVNETRRKSKDSAGLSELKIAIDPGTTPNDEIASVLSDISKIYRKMGGSGIAFKLDYVTINQEEVI